VSRVDPFDPFRKLFTNPPYEYTSQLLSPMRVMRIMMRMMAVVTVITTIVEWIGVVIGVGVIIWVVWVCVIISTSWSVTAFRRHDSVLRKSDPTNRIGVKKMIFPNFSRSLINSLKSDQVCFPPQRDHPFFRHVRSNIRNMTRVA
jgi:hypothetical protein